LFEEVCKKFKTLVQTIASLDPYLDTISCVAVFVCCFGNWYFCLLKKKARNSSSFYCACLIFTGRYTRWLAEEEEEKGLKNYFHAIYCIKNNKTKYVVFNWLLSYRVNAKGTTKAEVFLCGLVALTFSSPTKTLSTCLKLNLPYLC